VLYVKFLDAFAKLRKATVRFVTPLCPSVRPSARPHGTAQLPQCGVSYMLSLWIFRKSVTKIKVLIKI